MCLGLVLANASSHSCSDFYDAKVFSFRFLVTDVKGTTVVPRLNLSCTWRRKRPAWPTVNVLWLNVPLIKYRFYKVAFFLLFFTPSLTQICFSHELITAGRFSGHSFPALDLDVTCNWRHIYNPRKLSAWRVKVTEEIHVDCNHVWVFPHW